MVCTQGSLSDLPTQCSSEDLSNVWSSVLSSNLEIMRSSLDLDTLYSSADCDTLCYDHITEYPSLKKKELRVTNSEDERRMTRLVEINR
jgi:hypothetical protein